jgi:CubicO group peptidase (beta-lactamase class C family)
MAGLLSRREFVRASAQGAAVAAAGALFVSELALGGEAASAYQPIFAALDHFIEQYLREMNAPGLTFVMADRSGVQRVAAYGFSDTESKISTNTNQLFEIGSISKSFLAVCLLQLRDEGKLDLQRPIAEYLPWFRVESAFAPITVHHLLTHTAGIEGNAPVFLSDTNAKHRAANPPGEYFHYCNTGYALLGHLLTSIDGKPLGECLRARVFEPLGMTASEPVITLDFRDRLAKNYQAFRTERPYARFDPLAEAPAIIMTDASGCIAATPRDMGLYTQMIASHGAGPKSRVISESGFALFSKRHISAEEFGPKASYGYGIAVDTLDDHTVLRHTGGMLSFASALQVDIDEGVGAFASINAMQGYRPNPVAQYALQMMRAHRAGKPLPESPRLVPATFIENPKQYAGMYSTTDGKKWEFRAEGTNLFLILGEKRIPVETVAGSQELLVIRDSTLDRYALTFGREKADDPKSRVVEAGWGPLWFMNDAYSGPKTFDYPKEWDRYVGHYRNENPWVGSMRVVIRKGKLSADGVVPLEAGADGYFYFRDEAHSPEWVRFHDIVNEKAMRVKASGEDMWRVSAE